MRLRIYIDTSIIGGCFIDCIALKNQIQAQLWEKRKRLGKEEVLRRHREWLEHSDDSLAVWWRSLKPQRNTRVEPLA